MEQLDTTPYTGTNVFREVLARLSAFAGTLFYTELAGDFGTRVLPDIKEARGERS